MLERPAIDDAEILACLRVAFGLQAESVEFLPLGADQGTAVFRAATAGGEAYFVKLRRGDFLPASIAVPNHLASQGMRQVVPAQITLAGELCAKLDDFSVILSPFVPARDAYERNLSPQQWAEFGAALQRLHSTQFPPSVTAGIPREAFFIGWGDKVQGFLARAGGETFADPLARETAEFLAEKGGQILDLVRQAERFAGQLREHPPDSVLCHGDIHGWNLLVADDGRLYMVDWDTLVFAPKERDLMFVGAGLGESGYSPQEEESMFYAGYGPARVDRAAIAYYRAARILEDIALFCEQIFSSNAAGPDRQQALRHLKSNFRPGGTIERARAASRTAADPASD